MHEIDTIKARHSELDDAELDHLETQERLDGEAAELDAQRVGSAVRRWSPPTPRWPTTCPTSTPRSTPSPRSATTQRAAIARRTWSARYESTRAAFGGVAIARLNGRQCEGCHLDISAAEIDTLKATPPDQLPECPQCGRLLLRRRLSASLSPVFVWYIATAVATVWFVFRDPGFDYRLLIVGSVLPLGRRGHRWRVGDALAHVQRRPVRRRDGGDDRPARTGGGVSCRYRSARCSTSCSAVRGRTPTCSGGRSAG